MLSNKRLPSLEDKILEASETTKKKDKEEKVVTSTKKRTNKK